MRNIIHPATHTRKADTPGKMLWGLPPAALSPDRPVVYRAVPAAVDSVDIIRELRHSLVRARARYDIAIEDARAVGASRGQQN
jgi:hypothetical protein